MLPGTEDSRSGGLFRAAANARHTFLRSPAAYVVTTQTLVVSSLDPQASCTEWGWSILVQNLDANGDATMLDYKALL
eukprot:4716290-Amphidinium_carterae.1